MNKMDRLFLFAMLWMKLFMSGVVGSIGLGLLYFVIASFVTWGTPLGSLDWYSIRVVTAGIFLATGLLALIIAGDA